MTDTISFRVNGIPVAQPRQRHRIRSNGDKSFVQNYTPTKSKVTTFKTQVKREAVWAMGSRRPIEKPVVCSLTFVMPRPQRLCKKRSDNPRVPYTSRPDVDNLIKGLLDSCIGIVFKDDSFVFSIVADKWYAAGGEEPHVLVRFQEVC